MTSAHLLDDVISIINVQIGLHACTGAPNAAGEIIRLGNRHIILRTDFALTSPDNNQLIAFDTQMQQYIRRVICDNDLAAASPFIRIILEFLPRLVSWVIVSSP